MSKSTKIAAGVMAAILATGTSVAVTKALAATKTEKCYGVAAKGKNDCGSKTGSCAGTSKTDRNPNAWIFVMKGNCAKIAGGSTIPKDK